MAFRIETDGMPYSMDTYAAAAQHEAHIKPIRGSNPPLKPLGKRTKKHMNIRKDERTGDILCRLHYTDVVTYHPDDSITLQFGGWNTQSTNEFIGCLLGWGVHIGNTHGHTTMSGYYIDEAGETHHGTFAIPINEPVRLTRDNPNTASFRIHNPLPTYQHRINRKAMNQVRKQCEPALAYFDAMLKVRSEDGWIPKEYEGYRQSISYDPYVFTSDNPDVLAPYIEGMLYVCSRYVSPKAGRFASVSVVRDELHTALKRAFADTVTTRVQVPWGEVKKDPNPWAGIA